jgi:hypothetical protein
LLIVVIDRDPFFCSEERISINVNDQQPRTVASPMLVTEAGISIGINDEQGTTIEGLFINGGRGRRLANTALELTHNDVQIFIPASPKTLRR